jgi:SulP family sulfate permease
VLRQPRLLVRETLAGVVTALALIPEVISFSVIAGVDPKVSLIASVVLCLAMSFLGGRPAMVTAAAGSVALVIGPMVHQHGVHPACGGAGRDDSDPVWCIGNGTSDAIHPYGRDDRICQRTRYFDFLCPGPHFWGKARSSGGCLS